MKIVVPTLFLMLMLTGCTKKDNPDPISYQSTVLVNNASNLGKWRLSSLTIGSVAQTLTASQLVYVKQFTSDSKFSDTDGLMGSWNMPTTDKLIEVFSNFSSGIPVTQIYKINSISNSQLNLTYIVNGTEINAIYTASN